LLLQTLLSSSHLLHVFSAFKTFGLSQCVHFNSPLSINSLTIIYIVFVWSKLEQHFSPGTPPSIHFAIVIHTIINSLSCDCSVWIPLFRVVLFYRYIMRNFSALLYALMIFCHCQRLTGLEIKSTNNNNSNNKLSQLNRYFNIDFLPFSTWWRWCAMDYFPRKRQTEDIWKRERSVFIDCLKSLEYFVIYWLLNKAFY